MPRRRRDPDSRTVVRLPERDLAESVLALAAPLLDSLGAAPSGDAARGVIELAIDVWNAHVAASKFWGNPRPAKLAKLRAAVHGRKSPPGAAEAFEMLSDRWRREFAFDPRRVRNWTLETRAGSPPALVCEMSLPDGVEAEIPPPADKRISIGGRFLDEARVRLDATSYLSFPVESHRASVGTDGVVTVRAKLPTALQLFAEGRLPRVGGEPVEVTVGTRKLGPMVLSEVRCAGEGGHHDVAVLVFRVPDPTVRT